MLVEPFLSFLNDSVAMIQRWFKHDIGRQAVGVPLKCKKLGDRLRGCGAGMLGDQVKNQIMPGRGRAGHNQLIIVSDRNQGLLYAQTNTGKVSLESRRVNSVNGCFFALQ